MNTFTLSGTEKHELWRAKYFKNNLQKALRKMLVAEDVCAVDKTESFYIQNPYLTALSATVQAVTTGTYTPAAYTVTNEALTVTDVVYSSVHVYDFESRFANVNLFADFSDELSATVAQAIDKWAVNELCEGGTGTYDTAAGGFTTASNVLKIFADLVAKVDGYSDVMNGRFIVLENSDESGLLLTGATTGWNFADAVLRNGKVGNLMGVDVYIVRDSTFVDATTTTASGTKTWTNSGHRVFGVKKTALYAAPRGLQYKELDRTGYFGKEVVVYGYVGFQVWTHTASLIVDITVTA